MSEKIIAPYESGACAGCYHRFVDEQTYKVRCHTHTDRKQFKECSKVKTCSYYLEKEKLNGLAK